MRAFASINSPLCVASCMTMVIGASTDLHQFAEADNLVAQLHFDPRALYLCMAAFSCDSARVMTQGLQHYVP
jgi:hypothetical protein